MKEFNEVNKEKSFTIPETYSGRFSYKSFLISLFLFLIFFVCLNCGSKLIILFNQKANTIRLVTPPSAVINNAPADPSNDTGLFVTVSGTDVETYQYKLVAETTPCIGGDYNGTWLPVTTLITDPIGVDGNYKLCVMGRDVFLNAQPESAATSHTWTKDADAPTAVINNAPVDPSNDINLSVTVSGIEVVSYQYKLVADITPCTGGGYNGVWLPVTNLITDPIGPDGDYKLCVIGRDALSNAQPEFMATSYSWTKDATAPTAVINNAPADPSSDANLNVSISGADIESYQYKLVAGTAPCAGGGYNGVWLPVVSQITDPIGPDGDYKLCVIGRDTLLNTQPEFAATNYSWTKGINFWELEVTTTAPSQNMSFSMEGPVNLFIDWGDTNSETTTASSVSHTYASAGVYILKIRGQSSRIHFDNPDAQTRLTEVLSVLRGVEGITSFESTFSGCSNITGSIPVGMFDYAPLVTSFEFTFFNCSGLTGSIPAGLFDNNTEVEYFHDTFYGCTGLTGSIPSGLFDNNTKVYIFSGVFYDCSGLTGSIPDGLFDSNTIATDFGWVFYNCSGLTGSIPPGLFANNTMASSFGLTFADCTGLSGSIPAVLFVNNASVRFFNSTFYNCSGLTGTIPGGLFANNTDACSFELTLAFCTGLTGTIPSGFFNNNTQVTSFNGTFMNCTELIGPIPSGLFDNNTQAVSFDFTFLDSTKLDGSIPSGLFDNNTQVTNFASTFSGCSNLISVPSDLFDNNTLAASFKQTFEGATGITSTVPELWISHPAALHSNCFLNATSSANYAAIPADWK